VKKKGLWQQQKSEWLPLFCEEGKCNLVRAKLATGVKPGKKKHKPESSSLFMKQHKKRKGDGLKLFKALEALL